MDPPDQKLRKREFDQEREQYKITLKITKTFTQQPCPTTRDGRAQTKATASTFHTQDLSGRPTLPSAAESWSQQTKYQKS